MKEASVKRPLGHRNLVEGYMIELAVTLAEGGVNRCVHRWTLAVLGFACLVGL